MRLVPIGEICALRNGRAFKPTEWSTTGTPIIRIQNLTDETKPFNYCEFDVDRKYHVEKGNLLFSWSGTPGTSFGAFFWMRERGYLNQHIFRIDPYNPEDLHLDYFRLALNSKLREIIGQAHGGVGLKHITKAKLNAVEVYLPELNDQVRIAHLLGKVQGLIARRKQHLQQLDDLLKSVYLEMFGDPVLNEKGWPTDELFSFVDQDRGISYGIVQRGKNFPAGIPVLRIRDIIAEKYHEPDLVRTDPSISSKYARTILQGGELLLSIRGTVGTVSIAPPHSVGWNVSRELAIIPVTHGVNKNYLAHLLKSPPMQQHLSSMIKGVAQSGLNLSDIRHINVILPPCEMQSSYEKISMKIESLVSIYQSSLYNLEALYESLSQQAFNGELDLSCVPLPVIHPEGTNSVVTESLVAPSEQGFFLNLPNNDDLENVLQNADARKDLIAQWLETYTAQLGETSFSAQHFIETVEVKLAEHYGDTTFELKAKDYEHIKTWVFEVLANGRMQQSCNITHHKDGNPVLGNMIELKAVRA